MKGVSLNAEACTASESRRNWLQILFIPIKDSISNDFISQITWFLTNLPKVINRMKKHFSFSSVGIPLSCHRWFEIKYLQLRLREAGLNVLVFYGTETKIQYEISTHFHPAVFFKTYLSDLIDQK